ncbi:hypothetical protein TOPH_05785, partial [Tolypocladium ophioglossoides CBS 100239]
QKIERIFLDLFLSFVTAQQPEAVCRQPSFRVRLYVASRLQPSAGTVAAMFGKEAMKQFGKETMKQLAKAQRAEEFTDYVLHCEGQRFPVHKVIICSHSKFFRLVVTLPSKEASEVYELQGEEFSMVQRMVDYFYTGTYDDGSAEAETGEQLEDLSTLSVHARMFALADKYLINGLGALSARNYTKALERKPDLCDFLGSLPDVYTLTPASVRGLRSRAVDFAREKLTVLLNSPEMKDVYHEMVTDTPQFTEELLNSFIERPLIGHCHACGYDKPVPVVALQCRCKNCGKGGATAWSM